MRQHFWGNCDPAFTIGNCMTCARLGRTPDFDAVRRLCSKLVARLEGRQALDLQSRQRGAEGRRMADEGKASRGRRTEGRMSGPYPCPTCPAANAAGAILGSISRRSWSREPAPASAWIAPRRVAGWTRPNSSRESRCDHLRDPRRPRRPAHHLRHLGRSGAARQRRAARLGIEVLIYEMHPARGERFIGAI